jgi:GNAT superfamily N-acetyltransferase
VTIGFEIQLAQPWDARAIADLLAASLDAGFIQLVPCGCSGASEFIRMQIAAPRSLADSLYLVARSHKAVIGVAEWRHTPEGLFLNNIAVHHRYRGKGMGRALLSAGLGLLKRNSGKIALDSLEGNDRAGDWYRRLGFVTHQCTELAEISPPTPESASLLRISGLPQAELSHQRFGFSSFTVQAAPPVSVGRIGPSWFRLTDPDSVRDPAVFATLSAFEPQRRFLAVLPVSAMPAEQRIRTLAKLLRMEADMRQVLGRLAERNLETAPRLAAVCS